MTDTDQHCELNNEAVISDYNDLDFNEVNQDSHFSDVQDYMQELADMLKDYNDQVEAANRQIRNLIEQMNKNRMEGLDAA